MNLKMHGWNTFSVVGLSLLSVSLMAFIAQATEYGEVYECWYSAEDLGADKRELAHLEGFGYTWEEAEKDLYSACVKDFFREAAVAGEHFHLVPLLDEAAQNFCSFLMDSARICDIAQVGGEGAGSGGSKIAKAKETTTTRGWTPSRDHPNDAIRCQPKDGQSCREPNW